MWAPRLVISQSTLYAGTRTGHPAWQAATPCPVAEPLVDAVVSSRRALGARVEIGVFGVGMKIRWPRSAQREGAAIRTARKYRNRPGFRRTCVYALGR